MLICFQWFHLNHFINSILNLQKEQYFTAISEKDKQTPNFLLNYQFQGVPVRLETVSIETIPKTSVSNYMEFGEYALPFQISTKIVYEKFHSKIDVHSVFKLKIAF